MHRRSLILPRRSHASSAQIKASLRIDKVLEAIEDSATRIVSRPSHRNFEDLANEIPTYLKVSGYPLPSDLLEDCFTNRTSLRNVEDLTYEIVSPTYLNSLKVSAVVGFVGRLLYESFESSKRRGFRLRIVCQHT